jgi:ubiquinone/menaquinone biosynthesis C-methylase UbiE
MLLTLLNMIIFPLQKFLYKTHQERLEAFYAGQARTYDAYRDALLWARLPMLLECSKQLIANGIAQGIAGNLVWIDFGGGTGWNIEQMERILGNLKPFKEIILVDLCPSLCKIARERAMKRNWTNVTIICDDACTYKSPKPADFVTFSYSLSMIPDYKRAIENAAQHIAYKRGIIGVADFGVANTSPSHFWNTWYNRFWQTFFSLDSVYLHPERREYLANKFPNDIYSEAGYGRVPFMFGARAPYYIWIARAQ